MAEVRFSGEVRAGHEQAAVEATFDPRVEWEREPEALEPGRRGYRVRGMLGVAPFRGVMVPRSNKWWLVIEEADLREAAIAVGDTVTVTVEPES